MNSLPRKVFLTRNRIALFWVALMLVGFLGARALLTSGMIGFSLTALLGTHPRKWVKQKWWMLALAWLALNMLSYFWSANKHEWEVLNQVKLPFLVLPLAFSMMPPFSRKEQQWFTAILIFFMLSGVGWSVYHFMESPGEYIKGYKFSHLIPTPVYREYIHFSMALAMTVCWSIAAWKLMDKKWMRWLLALSIIIIIAYMHLLAAKTGLAMLYMFMILFTFHFLFKKEYWKRGLIALFLVSAIVWAAYLCIPTFSSRINYTLWTITKFKEGDRTGNYGDIGRVISYEISLKIIAEHPVTGVGLGDMLDEMHTGYRKYYPDIPPEHHLLPHNQFLATGLALGIPGLLLFLWWIIFPLIKRRTNRPAFYFYAGVAMLVVSLFTDVILEVQMGLFVFLFFLLWLWHNLCKVPVAPEQQL